MSEAFDRVWHNGGMITVWDKGDLLKWINISNRKQSVCFNGTSSNHGTLNVGVPQGSVLGPFLFLIYINDIADELDCACNKMICR